MTATRPAPRTRPARPARPHARRAATRGSAKRQTPRRNDAPPARRQGATAHPRRPAPARQIPARRRRRLTMTVTATVSLVAVFGVVGFNAFLVQSQFTLEKLEADLNTQRQEFEQLRLETARLSSPERILSISRTELGMVDPEVVTHLNAPSGSGEGDAGPGAAAWAEVKPYLAAEP